MTNSATSQLAEYNEPNALRRQSGNTYSLYLAAGVSVLLNLYRVQYDKVLHTSAFSEQVIASPFQHEELAAVSRSGNRLLFMEGPLGTMGYNADMYVMDLSLYPLPRGPAPDPAMLQLTAFNADSVNYPDGAQLSRISWNEAGNKAAYGNWRHGTSYTSTLWVMEFAAPCGAH